jgi:hypothetical protein
MAPANDAASSIPASLAHFIGLFPLGQQDRAPQQAPKIAKSDAECITGSGPSHRRPDGGLKGIETLPPGLWKLSDNVAGCQFAVLRVAFDLKAVVGEDRDTSACCRNS